MNIDQLFPPTSSSIINQPKKQLGQDDFMKLLVAQMNNQDPGNPADNGAFMAQMAQLSMVDGINKLGTSVTGVASSLANSQAIQAAGLVGHQVLTSTNEATLEPGGIVSGVLAVPDNTQGLNVQVRDSSGSLIKTITSGSNLSAGSVAFNWDGTNDNGQPQAPGEYNIIANALVNGQQQAVPLQLYNTVQGISVSSDHTAVQLQLPNQQLVDFSTISQYR